MVKEISKRVEEDKNEWIGEVDTTSKITGENLSDDGKKKATLLKQASRIF